jgi:hypothetical protein
VHHPPPLFALRVRLVSFEPGSQQANAEEVRKTEWSLPSTSWKLISRSIPKYMKGLKCMFSFDSRSPFRCGRLILLVRKEKSKNKNRFAIVKKAINRKSTKMKSMPVCKFFLAGRCNVGQLCRFSHAPPTEDGYPNGNGYPHDPSFIKPIPKNFRSALLSFPPFLRRFC